MKKDDFNFEAMKEIKKISFMLIFLFSCQKGKQLQTLETVATIETVPQIDIVINNYCLTNQQEKIQFIVYNRNLKIKRSGHVYDSDGDGLDDDQELKATELGLDPLKAYTFDNFYDDLIIFKSGLTASEIPSLPVASEVDADNDGIPDVVENLLGTEIVKPDSDEDGLPDLLELHFGLNPIKTFDAAADSDADGVDNTKEISSGMPLSESNAKSEFLKKYELKITNEVVSNNNAQTCYKYTVKGLALNPILDVNKIQFFFLHKTNSELNYIFRTYLLTLNSLVKNNDPLNNKTRYILELDYLTEINTP
ncbi:MAG: hypothetical protein QE271_11525 [Bacteriovoracaceae bacterium]|nr:hypothetical protein [Bacteriovoracaceae bacterium]